jgi:hypothetical protein
VRACCERLYCTVSIEKLEGIPEHVKRVKHSEKKKALLPKCHGPTWPGCGNGPTEKSGSKKKRKKTSRPAVGAPRGPPQNRPPPRAAGSHPRRRTCPRDPPYLAMVFSTATASPLLAPGIPVLTPHPVARRSASSGLAVDRRGRSGRIETIVERKRGRTG